MDAAFFDAVRASLYAGALNQTQVDSLNAIGQAWEQYGDGDPNKLAYILATAQHETGAFKWLKEIWGPTSAQKRYEGRADLGNNQAGDGKRFMGRGYVQLTGRRNYADWSRRTGLDLLKEPQLVEAPAVAARILVQGSMLGTFTTKKLGDYIGADVDFINARRVINGTDRADLIAGYARTFRRALSAAAAAAPHEVAPLPIDLPDNLETPASDPAKGTGIGWLAFALFAAVAACAAAIFIPLF